MAGSDGFDTLVREAAKLRGHLCLGLPLGVKMGLEGLRLLNMEEAKERIHLMVVVENNKCPADGIQVATGCSAGSRRLKVLDYGKSAAVFFDGATGKGFRVATKKDFSSRAMDLAIKDGLLKEGEGVKQFSPLDRKITMNAFMKMTPEELFDVRRVTMVGKAPFLSSLTEPNALCAECGEEIMDGKGVVENGRTLCGSCAHGPYYVSA
jgi:formylmethanofuran dehydrogenase subunit E